MRRGHDAAVFIRYDDVCLGGTAVQAEKEIYGNVLP